MGGKSQIVPKISLFSLGILHVYCYRQVRASPVCRPTLWGWCFLSEDWTSAGLDCRRRWDESESLAALLLFAVTLWIWIHCQFQLHTWLPSDWQLAVNLKPRRFSFLCFLPFKWRPPQIIRAGQYLHAEIKGTYFLRKKEEDVCEIWWELKVLCVSSFRLLSYQGCF